MCHSSIGSKPANFRSGITLLLLMSTSCELRKSSTWKCRYRCNTVNVLRKCSKYSPQSWPMRHGYVLLECVCIYVCTVILKCLFRPNNGRFRNNTFNFLKNPHSRLPSFGSEGDIWVVFSMPVLLCSAALSMCYHNVLHHIAPRCIAIRMYCSIFHMKIISDMKHIFSHL